MSAEDERAAWDRRYRQGSHTSDRPDPFLVYAEEEFIQPLFPHTGKALDLAGGAGRHAVFLAGKGWHVTLVDISQFGIDRARAAADRRGALVEFVVSDTLEFQFTPDFDLAIVFFYLERKLLPSIASALRPGGLVVYKTYTRDHENFASKGLSHPMYFLEPNELLKAFPDFLVLHYRESVHQKGIAELVARKPILAAKQ